MNADLAFYDGNPVLVVSDAGSGCTLHQVLGAKSEAFEGIKSIVTFIETQYDKKVKSIVTDNGTEFVNKPIKGLGIKQRDQVD